MDATSEMRLGQVHPQLADKIRQLAQQLLAQGVTIRVTQGLRSWDEQAALYAQGRTAPGNIVTHAPPGHSWHNFGLAVDVAPFDDNGQPIWDDSNPAWDLIVSTGTNLGLTSGANFPNLPDRPHFQLTGPFPLSPDENARQLYASSGIPSVWAQVA